MEEFLNSRLKHQDRIVKKGPLFYQLDEDGLPIRYQPWLGGAFAFLYDFFMARDLAEFERFVFISAWGRPEWNQQYSSLISLDVLDQRFQIVEK